MWKGRGGHLKSPFIYSYFLSGSATLNRHYLIALNGKKLWEQWNAFTPEVKYMCVELVCASWACVGLHFCTHVLRESSERKDMYVNVSHTLWGQGLIGALILPFLHTNMHTHPHEDSLPSLGDTWSRPFSSFLSSLCGMLYLSFLKKRTIESTMGSLLVKTSYFLIIFNWKSPWQEDFFSEGGDCVTGEWW